VKVQTKLITCYHSIMIFPLITFHNVSVRPIHSHKVEYTRTFFPLYPTCYRIRSVTGYFVRNAFYKIVAAFRMVITPIAIYFIKYVYNKMKLKLFLLLQQILPGSYFLRYSFRFFVTKLDPDLLDQNRIRSDLDLFR
jgi:hypothetical protein